VKDTMRTWKDCNRQSLTTRTIELTDAELETICGGALADLMGTAKDLGGQLPVVGPVVSQAGSLTSLLGGVKVAGL